MNKEKLFWDFGYLMVVVEDKWLEFPNEIYEMFVCDENETVYSFITNYHVSSDRDKINFLKFKAKQVLAFVRILEKSLGYEKKRYSSVFRRLEEAQVDTEIIEAFDTHLKGSIEDFSKTYVGENAKIELREYVEELDKNRYSLEKKIDNCFSKYHGNPSFRTIGSKMEKYFSERN